MWDNVNHGGGRATFTSCGEGESGRVQSVRYTVTWMQQVLTGAQV